MTDPLRMGYVAQLTTTAVEPAPLSMSMYASSADYWRARAEAAEKDAAKLREDIGPLLADMTALEAENEQLRQDAERWAPVAGYESMYEVSTVGRIRSLSRVDSDGNRRKGAALVPYKKATGYLQVALCRGGERSEQYVHRLVAKAFLDNPDSKPQVNHIDGDPANNEVRNLEWATNAENQTHCRRILAKGVTAVIGTCIKTGAQVRFGTLAEAGEAGFTRANIQKCLSGRRSHAGGYRWSALDAAIDAAISVTTGSQLSSNS